VGLLRDGGTAARHVARGPEWPLKRPWVLNGGGDAPAAGAMREVSVWELKWRA